MTRRVSHGRGDKAALLALLGIIAIFVFIVGRGWQTLFGGYGIWLSLSAGGVVAVIATALCYAIASERVFHPEAKATALAYFFVLFNISALGTINAMFLMFQSSNIVRDHVDAAIESVVSLRDVGASGIDTTEHDAFRASVNERWRNLKAELENPQLCCQGAVAAARIEELQLLLPSFRALAGGGRCEKVPLLIASYQKQIDELVSQSPVYLKSRKNLELKARIASQSDQLLEELNLIGKTVSGNFTLTEVKARLFDVSEKFSVLRQELGSKVTGEQAKVPMKIDTKSISALGDIGQILPFIMSRLGDVSTYVYLLIALILDIAVIAAFARVLREGPSANRIRSANTVRRV